MLCTYFHYSLALIHSTAPFSILFTLVRLLPNKVITPPLEQKAKLGRWGLYTDLYNCPLRGDIRKNWNDTEKISMAPAQG